MSSILLIRVDKQAATLKAKNIATRHTIMQILLPEMYNKDRDTGYKENDVNEKYFGEGHYEKLNPHKNQFRIPFLIQAILLYT